MLPSPRTWSEFPLSHPKVPFPHQVGRAFTQLDTNDDLTVDAEELGAGLDGPQGAAQHLVDFLKHSALMRKRDQWSD